MIETMKIRQLGDVVLKPGHSPILSFLAPTTTPTTIHSTRSCLHFPASTLETARMSRRCLHAQTSSQQDHPTTTNTSKESISDVPTPQPARSMAGPQEGYERNLYNLLGSLSKPSPRSTTYTSANRSKNRVHGNYASSTDVMRRSRDQDNRSSVARQQSELLNEDFTRQGISDSILDVIELKTSGKVKRLDPRPPPLRLDAFMGRAQPVKQGQALWQAMRYLDINLASNRVRADLNYQRFHERPGLKRKRLKSQRWRRRFKEGFKAMVSKVQRMRNQGW